MFVWIPCGFFAGAIAADKDHNEIAWIIAGFLWGPIGVIAAAGLSDRRQRRILRLIADQLGADSSDTSLEIKSGVNEHQEKSEPEGDIEGDDDYNSCVSLYRQTGGMGEPFYANHERDGVNVTLINRDGLELARFKKKKSGNWHMPFWLN